MKGKAALLAGLSIGYVLGTRDGRERYEQIKAQANRAWHNPRVQKTAEQAQTRAQEAVKQAADTAQDKVRRGHEAPTTSTPSPDPAVASSAAQGPS